jgi:7-cyano-7-deazaguanine synthase in queuosine biosynthesis
MPNERLILCGSVKEDELPFEEAYPLRLRMWGPHRNVHLKIQDVREAMWRDVPTSLLDLIDIAVYVYCADQAITRGGDGVQDFGQNWRRRLFFRIPVRNVDLWNSKRTQAELVSTLSFLSEDEFHFQFEQLRKEEPFQHYLDFNTTPFEGTVEEVVMFSGGIDSLGGAVQEAVVDKRRIVLVNHRSTQKLSRRHRDLVNLLGKKAEGASPIHIPVRINKKKHLGREYTQRTRSFLYVALGGTVATMVGLNRLRFYENGVISLNLPPSAQVVGARATRTTHPQVLKGYSRLLSHLAEKNFAVENPMLWKTKTEVMKLIANAGCGELVKHTSSCTRTWEATRLHTHCGICSQCIDRRFAVLAAGCEALDPSGAYKVDLLTGERVEGHPRTMLSVYVETASEITKMTALQFFCHYGEASRVLRHIADTPEAAAIKIFELHQRHSRQVTGVVDQAISKNATAIRNRDLPSSCLLRLVCDSSAAAGERPDRSSKATRPSMEDNVFRRKGQAWEVRFASGQDFILLPSKGTAYLHLLISHPGIAFSAVDIASRVAKNPNQYALGSAGEQSDREALTAYRARYEELKEELDEARKNNDSGAESRIQEEIEWLTDQIRKDRGLGGRLRKASDDRERVRKAVGMALKRAIKEIASYDQRLAHHLSPPLLICGQNPCYVPDQDVQWET